MSNQGADHIPIWSAINLVNGVAGVLTVPNGGTGVNTITQYNLLIGDGVNPVNEIANGTNGQVLLAATGAASAFATLTSSGTISFTPAANALALDCRAASESQTGVVELATTTETYWGTYNYMAVTPEGNANYHGRQKYSGFYSWSGAGAYYSVAGTTFTLLRDCTVYILGKQVAVSGSQSVGPLAAGSTYYAYINAAGTLASTSTRTDSLFEENAVLFEILVDSDTPENVIVVKENHPSYFQPAASNYLHHSIGTVISDMTNGANIAKNGTKGIQIDGADTLLDHGLSTTIPDSAAAAVSIKYMFTDGSGKWVLYLDQNTVPSVYNNAGTVTALGAGKFGTFRIYVSKDDINSSTPTYFAVLNTAQHNNLTAAETAINNGIAEATAELADLELCQLGYIIFEQAADEIAEVIIAKDTLYNLVQGAGGTSDASLVNTNTTNFDGWLSAADTTVQQALETLDELNKYMVVDNMIFNGNTISTSVGQLFLSPIAGQPIRFDESWELDGTAITGYVDANLSIDAHAGRSIAIESVTFDGGVVGAVTTLTMNSTLTNSSLNTAGGIVQTDGSGVFSTSTDLPTATTIGTAYVYRVGGTDIAIADGGTNSSAALANGKMIVSSGGAIVEGTPTVVGGAIGSVTTLTLATVAFGAGAVDLTTTDTTPEINIGYNNTVTTGTCIGGSNTANGSGAMSLGYLNEATAQGAFAAGYDNTASGAYSFAAGYQNTPAYEYGIAIGDKNNITDVYGIAIGRENTAADYSVSIGRSNSADNYGAAIGGRANTATGVYTLAIGYTNTATSSYGFALGNQSTCTHNYSLVWSDSTARSSSAANEVTFGAAGGFRILGGGLTVGNLSLATNTISSVSGALNLTPVAGSAAVIDSVWSFDSNTLSGVGAVDLNISPASGQVVQFNNLTTTNSYTKINGGELNCYVGSINWQKMAYSYFTNDYIGSDGTYVSGYEIRIGDYASGIYSYWRQGGDGAPHTHTTHIGHSSSGATATSFLQLESDSTVRAQLGDNAGTYKFSVADSDNAEVAYINSDGKILGTDLVIDSLELNGNTLSSTSGALNLTPFAGNAILMDSNWAFDGSIMYQAAAAIAYIKGNGANKVQLLDAGAGAQIHVYASTGVNTATGFSIGTVTGAGATADHMFMNWDATNHVAYINAYSGSGGANRYMPINMATQAGGSVNIGTARTTGDTVKLRVGGTTSFDDAVTFSSGDVTVSAGNVKISGAAKQLQVEGGAVTDFIGQLTLVAGTKEVANTNIAAGDKIMLSRQSINGSTALGMLTYTITAATKFTVTSVQPGTPADTETNDVSIIDYFIVRQL